MTSGQWALVLVGAWWGLVLATLPRWWPGISVLFRIRRQAVRPPLPFRTTVEIPDLRAIWGGGFDGRTLHLVRDERVHWDAVGPLRTTVEYHVTFCPPEPFISHGLRRMVVGTLDWPNLKANVERELKTKGKGTHP